MPLLKSGKIIDDPRQYWDGPEGELSGGQPIVTLRQWREHRDHLLALAVPLGILLSSEQTPGEIREDLKYFDVVALDFPAFTDGRSYSNAKRLRERFKFKGEVRAVGDVLRDQYLNLVRCGFDALEVQDGETEAGFVLATGAISTPFQPGLEGQPTAMSLRQRRLAG